MIKKCEIIKKIKIIFILSVIINTCILCQPYYQVRAATNVSAKDLIDIAGDSWEKNYKPDEASLTREYVNKTAGEAIMKKIDEDFENIKITEKDMEGLNKKQSLLLFAALYAKWNEMSEEEKDKYQGKDHFNFDGIYAHIDQTEIDEKYENIVDPPDPIYVSPNRKDEGKGKEQADLDDILTSANEFVQGQDTSSKAIDDEVLQNLSSTFYNILFAIGVAATVIVGMIIGIKYMMGSVEEKANYKQMLLPYFIGCIVVYGAFGIWKIIIEIMQII